MPKQNKPVVRDGRLHAPKKRTDRSYLGTPVPSTVEPASPEADPAADPIAAFDAGTLAAVAAPSPGTPVAAAPTVTRVPAPAPQAPPRRRRDIDPEELLAQDSSYAIHELRRIGIITVIILGTLIGLGVFIR